MDPWSALLALILEIYQLWYEFINVKFMGAYNFRFKKDYNDGLAWFLFFYNCFNYFFPLAAISLYKQSFLSVFTIMFIFLVLEQSKNSLARYLKPVCCYRKQVYKNKKNWKKWNK